MKPVIGLDHPQWMTDAMRAAQDLAPGLNFRIDQLLHAELVHDTRDLRIVLPFGHAVPEGSTIFCVPVVHADVPAPMVALGLT